MATRRTTAISAAASTYDMVTLDTLKDELQIADTSYDGRFQRWITQCSRAIMRYSNRTFAVETLTDSFFPDRDPYAYQVPNGTPDLQLSRYPVLTRAADPEASPPIAAIPAPVVIENGLTLVEGTDYVVDYDKGLLQRLGTTGYAIDWPAWNVTVAYTAGFATIPEDVEDACIRLVKGRYYAEQRDPLLKSEDIPGVGKFDYWIDTGKGQNGNMPPDVLDLLDNYRDLKVI